MVLSFILSRMRRVLQARRAAKELARFSDRELADIGLLRRHRDEATASAFDLKLS
ncbi:MAG TPA: DUF1127 domain-containing protein [Microvirga sp.]|jgi:uncharacterized protein YjiS (DUF1127 family)